MLLLSLYTVSSVLEIIFPSLESMSGLLQMSKDIYIITVQSSGSTIFLQHISFPVAFLISLLSWSLGIPVDYRGLGTLKNHFFHTFNSLSCILCLYFSDHEWESKKVILPFRYGIAYALFQFGLQYSGRNFKNVKVHT